MKDKSNSEAFFPLLKDGQGLSCGANQENGLFSAGKVGDIETMEALLKREPSLLYHTSVYDCHAALHIAAANGQIEGHALFVNIRDARRATPLHLAARLRRKIPYVVALKYKHGACAALLNPSSTESLVWPAPLKFISELNDEAKSLLEHALMEANRKREKNILKGTCYSLLSPSPSYFDSGLDHTIVGFNKRL
ncbi:hypothetical protein V6N13_034270 [Hibiscus sabdariffa]